jgi:hypothetical protein
MSRLPTVSSIRRLENRVYAYRRVAAFLERHLALTETRR